MTEDPDTTDEYPMPPPRPDTVLGDGGTPGEDVDPEDPRPAGRYPRFNSNTWHYIPEELAQTVSLGPAGDSDGGEDWVLSYTPEERDDDDREKVFVRLTPPALQELYIETKNLSPDARQAGHTAECGLCGEQVPLEDAWPDNRERPCHPRCYAEAFGTPSWADL